MKTPHQFKKRGFAATLLVVVGLCAYLCSVAKQSSTLPHNDSGNFAVIGYVKEGDSIVPDPDVVTHLFVGLAGVNEDCNGVELHDTAFLQRITALKKDHPDLKLVLTIGNFRPKGWSEMASDSKARRKFAADCAALISEYNLDGVDLDWEFPTTTAGGLTARADDDRNYVKLMKDIRKKIGKEKLITFYSNNSGKWIDFKGMLPYVDYVMVSGYNLSVPPKAHQSNLYTSDICGDWSVEKSINRHIQLGVPPAKIMLGIPFYARTAPIRKVTYVERPYFQKYFDVSREHWDDKAKVPYIFDEDGNLLAAYDNQRSIQEKARFIKDRHLAGAFYWHCGSDDSKRTMAGTLFNALKPSPQSNQ